MAKKINIRKNELRALLYLTEGSHWKYTLQEICNILGGISRPTLDRYCRKFGYPKRGNKQPVCDGCDYLIPDCICDGTGIAHG